MDRIWLGARRVPMGMELRRESKALPRVQLLFTLLLLLPAAYSLTLFCCAPS